MSTGFRYRRLEKSNAAVLLVDHQSGLCRNLITSYYAPRVETT